MQTRQAMSVDDYCAWSGRAEGFDDMPFFASLSVPMIYRDRVLGVINAHQTRPGRIFNTQDITTLELLTPLAAAIIAQARLEEQEQIAQALLADHTEAVLLFDTQGVLLAANEPGQQMLQAMLGDTDSPVTIQHLADRTNDSALADLLAAETAQPVVHTLKVAYHTLGRLRVEWRTLGGDSAGVLVILHPVSGKFTIS